MNDELRSLPVKVDVGARLNIELKAEVPTDTVRRFVDALTDIIRPWSEARGLKADLLRLHREEVALKIAQRAAHRVSVDPRANRLIPLKILIPILENGSQEEATDDYMIDMWASLLASTAKDTTVSPRFVGILSEINTRQAKLLVHIATWKGPFDWGPLMWLNGPGVEARAKEVCQLNRPAKETALEIASFFSCSGTIHRSVMVVTRGDDTGTSWNDESLLGLEYNDDLETDLMVLTSLGLLDCSDIRFETPSNSDISRLFVSFYVVSLLARKLLGLVMPELKTWTRFSQPD